MCKGCWCTKIFPVTRKEVYGQESNQSLVKGSRPHSRWNPKYNRGERSFKRTLRNNLVALIFRGFLIASLVRCISDSHFEVTHLVDPQAHVYNTSMLFITGFVVVLVCILLFLFISLFLTGGIFLNA